MSKNDLSSVVAAEQAPAIAIENNAEQAKQLEAALRNMTPAELLELVEFYLDTTDVVMEGASMANSLDIGQATLTSALMRTRDGLEKVIAWLSVHYDLKEEEETSSEPDSGAHSGEEYL
jgi:excinuclease UvrABC helicase subunit UvrB